MKNIFMVAALCCVWNYSAVAQTPSKAAQAPRVPTTLAPINQSLSALLDKGWIITAGGEMVYTLHKGSKWITCGVHIGMMTGGGPSSECFGLN